MKAKNIISHENGKATYIFLNCKSGWTLQYERTKTGGWSNVLGGGLWFETQKGMKEYAAKKHPNCIFTKIVLDDYINEHIDEFI